MSRTWRWVLVAITAATVVGGLLPHALRSEAEVPISTVAKLAEEPPILPNGCADAVCGKGAPMPVLPTLTISAIDATIVAGLAIALVRLTRRLRRRTDALPRGSATLLFHPPQFSPFDLI